MTLALCFLASYLLGTIPNGLMIARAVKGIDIREHGSRNIGATNVFRVVGKKWGILVFVLDSLKGFAAVYLPSIFLQNPGTEILAGLGVTAIMGHTFPVWLGFKGGKGVATSLGVFIGVAPLPTLVTFGFWCLIFAITHIISISSLSAACFFPLSIIIFRRQDPAFPWLLGISLLLGAFIFYTHRSNIGRLLRKEEKKLF